MDTRINRRVALSCVGMALSGSIFSAEPYPDRQLKLVVGYTPGGAGDALARLMARKYSEAFGQPAVVENKPGAGATIAAAFVARATPDGYTLLINTAPDSIIGPLTMRALSYSLKDFAPIGLLTIVPSVLVVPASSPFQRVSDVIAAARANPGKLSYGSFGNGSSAHMAAELFKSLTGTSITNIPFKGSAPAMTELLAGRLDLVFDTFASSGPQIQSGALRALAVTSASRVSLAPKTPTMQEAGVADYVSQAFIGLVAPARTPPSVIKVLERETRLVMSSPDFLDVITKLGMVPAPGTPEDYTAFLQRETDRDQRLIKDANLQFDN